MGSVVLAAGCFDPTDIDDPGTAGSSSSTQTGVTAATESDESESAGPSDASTTATETDPGTDGSVDTSMSTTGTTPAESSTTDTSGTESCSTFDPQCEPGTKCNPYADDGGAFWNALGCFPLDRDPVGVGSPCTVEGHPASGVDDCEAGAMCWDVDPDTNEGVCRPFCTGSEGNAICENPGTTCATAFDDVVNLCLAVCDPLLQDCLQNYACAPLDEAFVCALDVSGGGEGGYGSDCDAFNACNPGLFCASPPQVPDCSGAAAGCCTEFCDMSDPNVECAGSASGQECIRWFDEGQAPPGYEDVGYCGL